MAKRVAVVTGANKGIGFAIVRGLCKQFQGDVYLTARNEERGQKAVTDLKSEGLNPKFHQLDLNNKDSIEKFRAFIQAEYGGLDVLVNNAGMAYKNASTAPFSEQAEETVKTNFTGTLDVCQALFPLLNPHARVVNVSSMVAVSSLGKCSAEIRSKFTDKNLTMESLKGLMDQFVSAAQTGQHQAKGFSNTAYGMSKVGVTCMSLIQQRELNADSRADIVVNALNCIAATPEHAAQTGQHQAKGFSNTAYGMSKVGVTCMSLIQQRELNADSRADIVVNACCPGYVDTDMTSHKGHKTIDQGADTPLYLALLPANTTSPKGNHVSERKIQPWK